MLMLTMPACQTKPAATKSKESPAKVEKVPHETEISRITLTEKAEHRLGITLHKVNREAIQRRRTFGGETMIPGGKSIVVSAPVAGTIAAPERQPIPLPGEHVEAGTPVLSLAPLLTPERDVPTPVERVQMANARATLLSALTIAKGDLQRSQAEVDGAQIALTRAKQLLADKAGSAKAVDEAQALLNIAQSGLEAARSREQQFEQLVAELDANGVNGTAVPLAIAAPQTGVIRVLNVSRGQTVSAGAPLFEVVDTQTMWVRVSLYVDLLSQIKQGSNATIVGLGQASGGESSDDTASVETKTIIAKPIAAPPSADPLSSTADLYYEIENTQRNFRPGQRVGVELVFEDMEQALVVPPQAVLYDIYGGTWVYVKVGDHAFQRQRITIVYTTQQRAVLEVGPAVGAEVVVDGAAELFGTEFGAGK